MNDQMANPFRKRQDEADAAPRRPPQGGTPRELARLYIMALVFFMSVATMVYMWKAATAPPKKKVAQGVSIRPDGSRPGPDGPAQVDAPPLPPVKKDVALQELPRDGVVDFKALAAPFRDGVEKPVKETPEFIAMLRVMLASMTPEALSKRVSPELNADRAYLEAQKHRGEVLRTYGRLVKIYTEPLDTTIPEKIEHVHVGIMMEYPTNRTVWFYLPAKPLDEKTGQPIKFATHTWKGEEFYDDWVEVDGVVLRRFDYPSQYENEKEETAWARSLVLFSKGVRLSQKPQMGSAKAGFVTVVVVLAVVVVAIVLTAGIMSRKFGGRDASLRLTLAAVKREKAKARGESIFPVPGPAPGAEGVKADVPSAAKDAPPAP